MACLRSAKARLLSPVKTVFLQLGNERKGDFCIVSHELTVISGKALKSENHEAP